MITIRLSPHNRLILDTSDQEKVSGFNNLARAFKSDWREGLFSLGAGKDQVPWTPETAFWGGVASHFLTRICHLPPDQTQTSIDPPSQEQINMWVESAPPMAGGEYLNTETLELIWHQLVQWGTGAMAQDGGLEKFLSMRAPKWNKVGRVTFHLAENKNDPKRPFAFMASFSTGIGSGGQLKHLPLGKAFELYAGTRNRQALIKLLTPVNEAAARCSWVREMVDNRAVYRPMAWSAGQAYQMLRSAAVLKESGLSLRLPDWWKRRPRPRVSAVIGETRKSRFGADSMLDFSVDVALGEISLSREEIEELLSGEDGLVMFKGQWIEVDKERLQEAISHWEKVEKLSTKGEVSFIEGMRMLAGAARDPKEAFLDQEAADWSRVIAGKALQEVLHGLRNPASIGQPEMGSNLKAVLRPYQKEGTAWLNFLSQLGLGACLADDMGLGKTIQVLALLSLHCAGNNSRPSLLIIPASLLGNWRSEARRFAPGLKLFFLHPSELHKKDMQNLERNPSQCLKGYDLVVTTYAMASRTPWLSAQRWNYIILDEAQAIKNHSTNQSKAVKKLQARARIALTGTPIENRLGDIWSLFDFLNPGLLGSARQFKNFVKELEESPQKSFGPLRKLVSPYILRRLKTDKSIISDLPDKTETIQFCYLTREQVRYYHQAVTVMKDALKNKERIDDMARRGIVLQTLVRLKQICNHPGQFLGDNDFSPAKSGKFVRIAEICRELAQRQEKVLIFTQFREIISPLEEYLTQVFGRPGLHLHGGVNVKQRKKIVDSFQKDDGPPFFILSLKAGGTGLNLTAASHVIHFDRWWNPAVENQATDRSFRIGQKKNVLVHKFVTSGTIEEKIDLLISEKKELARQMLSSAGEIKLTELPDEQLMEMVSLDITRASMT